MKVHLIGIGGYGMKVLAFFLKGKGYEVSGSDLFNTEALHNLNSNGIKSWAPHNKKILEKINPDLIIYSLAIRSNNEELAWAKSNLKPTFTRGQMLAKLLPNKNSIGITGTDGKTTTTSMIAEIFYSLGRDYNLYVGGDTSYFKKNIVYDDDRTFICEIDESDPDFKIFSTEVATVTNLYYDHLENYENDRSKQFLSTKKFLENSEYNVVNYDLKELLSSHKNTFSFGLEKGDLHIEDPKFVNFSTEFTVNFKGDKFKAKLNVPYLHNIENSLAASLSSFCLQIPIKDAYKSLYYYKGVKRRFEIKFRNDEKNIYVIDDYAHNPREVINTVKAAKLKNLKLITIFQPHRYSRFKAHWKDFADSLMLSDLIIISDIFGAYEEKDTTVTPDDLNNLLKKYGKDSFYMKNFVDILSFIQNKVKSNAVILTLGAGDITNLCDEIVKIYV